MHTGIQDWPGGSSPARIPKGGRPNDRRAEQPLGMRDQEPPHQEASQRQAHDVRALDAERIEDGQCALSEPGRGVGAPIESPDGR